LGAIISAGETAAGQNPSGIDWGVLQAIGMAGLITLLVIRLPSIYRWVIGAGILLAYQIILDNFLIDLTIQSPHGGLFGSLNWAAMMILGTALADLFHSEERRKGIFPWASLTVLAAGIALAFLIPISKHRVSSSYVLISLGASALLFLLFDRTVQLEGPFPGRLGDEPAGIIFSALPHYCDLFPARDSGHLPGSTALAGNIGNGCDPRRGLSRCLLAGP
jgi:hypothetical protein